jgi:heat shock protein HslJ
MLRPCLSPAAVLVLPLILGACGGSGGGAPDVAASSAAAPLASATVPASASSPDLAGTSWEALTLNGAPVTTSPAPTLAFGRAGRVTASGGCNSFSGSVRAGGGGIAFGEDFAATARACPGDLEARDRAMLAALRSAARYAQAGERLTLFDATGAPVALLLPAL